MDMDTTNFTDLLSLVAAEAVGAPLLTSFSPPTPPPIVDTSSSSGLIINAQEVYSCTKCQQTFSGKGARQVHVRKTHQPKTILKHPNGLRIILERRPNGYFHCPEPNCDYKTNDPWPVQAHYIRHFENNNHSNNTTVSVRDVVVPPRPLDVPEDNSVVYDNADDIDLEFCLADMGYIRNTKLNLIICKACRVCIQPRSNMLFRHAKRLHNLSAISIPEIEKILESLDPRPCDEHHADIKPYMEAGAVKMAPVAGLPVSYGWQCRICHQSSLKFTVMRKHFMMHHKGMNSKENSQPAFVQSLFGGKHVHYIAVDIRDSNIFPMPPPPPPSSHSRSSNTAGGPAQPSFIDADHVLVLPSLPDPTVPADVASYALQQPSHAGPVLLADCRPQLPPSLGSMNAASTLSSLSACQDFQISEDNLFLAPDFTDDGMLFRNAITDDPLLDERLRALLESSKRCL